MPKYTDHLFTCQHCDKRNNFLVSIVKEKGISYYLTQCPRCKSYDEVKKLTPDKPKPTK